jgi:hypothetical protein
MILADYDCAECGVFEALVPSPSPDFATCPICDAFSPWAPTPIAGRVKAGEVERGKVAQPDSPMFCDTRELGEGMPLKEWKAKRQKLYAERRHREGKAGL